MLQAFPSKYSTAKLECRTLTALLMGRIARDADASICCCTSPPHGPDLGDAGRTGHTCPLWVQAEQECRRPEGGTNSVAVETAMRRPAALAGLKELFFLLSILLSSRFCNVCGADDTARKKASQGCEGSTERMIWSVRAWGVASVSLALILLFPSLHSWEPAEAKSSSSNPGFSKPFSPRSFLDSPVFKEAPSVRNGINCLPCASSAAFVCDPVSVHVAMTLDGVYLRGSIAAVFSILQHATCPENVVFHFLVTENDREFRSLMLSTFPFLKFKIYRFDASLVRDRISSSVRQALEQPLNYARNYLADLLEPCVGRVIYLDSDLIVVDDISKLWNTSLGPHTIGAPEYCHANFTKYFSSSFWVDAELSSTFEGRRPCYFNTGVMIIDMVKWRQQNYTRMIEQWMEIQKERRIYELGSLPPFLLVFAGLVEPVEHRWNQHGLGGDNVKGSCRPLHSGPVSLLHWSGEGKPWTRLDSRQPCPLDSLWAPYDLFVNSVY